MEKEFVPYELAVKLKELGFDEPCFGWYSNREGNVLRQGYCETYLGIENCAKAPLYQQAFRWFREKYGLYDTISKNGYMIEGELNKEFLRITKLSLKSPEEAELACLTKLIEIVESKSE